MNKPKVNSKMIFSELLAKQPCTSVASLKKAKPSGRTQAQGLIFKELPTDSAEEAKILEAISFPGRSQHVIEHAKLLSMGLELLQEFKDSALTMGYIFQFLASEMVLQHMLTADLEYFPFIIEDGV